MWQLVGCLSLLFVTGYCIFLNKHRGTGSFMNNCFNVRTTALFRITAFTLL